MPSNITCYLAFVIYTIYSNNNILIIVQNNLKVFTMRAPNSRGNGGVREVCSSSDLQQQTKYPVKGIRTSVESTNAERGKSPPNRRSKLFSSGRNLQSSSFVDHRNNTVPRTSRQSTSLQQPQHSPINSDTTHDTESLRNYSTVNSCSINHNWPSIPPSSGTRDETESVDETINRSSADRRRDTKQRFAQPEEYRPRYKMEKREDSGLLTDTSNTGFLNLSSEQRQALNEFRSRVSSIASDQERKDALLLQWLTARNFSVDKAEEMFKKSQEWRKEQSLDDILSWEPPEVLVKYSPQGILGPDKYGGSILIIPHGGADIRGLLMSSKKAEHIRYTIQALERSKALMVEESKKRGHPVTQQTCIFDMDGFSLKDFTWKPALDLVVDQMQMYEANYPELLRVGYVINAPKLFTVAYAIVKPFLHEATINKLQIYGRTGWQEMLLKDIDASVLPKHWGGTRVDPDGNEKCPSVVCLGGEVPKSYYSRNKSKEYRRTLNSVTVGKGVKEEFTFKVTAPQSILRWEFETDDYDIGFSVRRDHDTLQATHRVNSHLSPEQGQVVCDTPGTYTVIFDNSFSYMRSKKLHYNIELLSPESKQ